MTSPVRTAADPASPRPALRPAVLGLIIGSIAALAAIAVTDLTAWILSPDAAPLSVLAAFLARLLPTTAADTSTTVADVLAHPLTMVTTGAMVVALGALAGLLELWRRWAGAVVFGVLAVVWLTATLVVVPSWLHTFLPALVGPIAGFVVLRVLISRLIRHLTVTADLSRVLLHGRVTGSEVDGTPAEPVDLSRPVTWQRRAFLRTLTITGAIAAAAVAVGEGLLFTARQAAVKRGEIRLPDPAVPAPTVPPGANVDVKGLTPYVTDNADFYRIDTALHIPVLDPATWQLKVTGMVERELTLTYAELLARPLVAHLSTLTCKANPIGANPIAGNLVGNATWLGLPVREVLAEAKPLPAADMVLSVSVDGWSAGTPLSLLQQEDRQALLAVGMNGQPLPPEHGFPVRMIVPGLYGDVSATKWVSELKVTTFAADQGYWTPLGWSVGGAIKLTSRIDAPRSATLEPGEVMVGGIAYAPHLGISRVQVRIGEVVDGSDEIGDWRDAELAETVGPDTWRQWSYRWMASPGRYRLTVRATDADGYTQTDEVRPPAPSGATGWHTINVRIREA